MCVIDCKNLEQIKLFKKKVTEGWWIKLFSLRSIFALYTKSEYQNNITLNYE